jgi:KaiC/GvpD/RAD55 family RecA-like ATPase
MAKCSVGMKAAYNRLQHKVDFVTFEAHITEIETGEDISEQMNMFDQNMDAAYEKIKSKIKEQITTLEKKTKSE